MPRTLQKKNLSKAESITVRLEPRIRYGLELLARKQHRNLSGVVEWAIKRGLDNPDDGLIEKDERGRMFPFLNSLWHVEESDRVLLLAEFKPELLTYEEGRIVSLILESDLYAEIDKELGDFPIAEKARKRRERMRKHFPIFKKVALGELPKVKLPKPSKG